MQTAGGEEIDWEARKKQSRLDNLMKAREAARLKREEKASVVLVPLTEPEEDKNEKKRKYAEPEQEPPQQQRDVRLEQIPFQSRDGSSFYAQFLPHFGRFMLTLGGVVITAVLPAILQSITDSYKQPLHQPHPETRAPQQDARGDDLYYGQSIFK